MNLEIREKLEVDLCQVASLGFRRPLTPDFRVDIARHIRGGFLQVAINNQQPVAFAMTQYYPDIGAAYLAGLVKIPSAPSGLVERMVGEFIDQFDPAILVTRTQNDRVMDIICRYCPLVVPLDYPASSKELQLLATLNLLTPATDHQLLISRGHYGSQMIFDCPRRRSIDSRVARHSDQLRYEAGDAALLIGYRKQL